ncbi:hypothetical protein GGR54DRAFT_627418 [Hypoxylon sp. NC1633]|nr:hypothetical protein GGR54DRAFT_627418 [Hypoxylon sp. NC1633]
MLQAIIITVTFIANIMLTALASTRSFEINGVWFIYAGYCGTVHNLLKFVASLVASNYCM